MTVIMVCVVTVMLLIWLLLGSWIGYCSAGIWVIYTGAKSGCKLVTLFDSYSYDGVSAGIWVIHTGAKSGCKLVTLLSGLWYDKLWGPSQRVVTLFFGLFLFF